MNAPTTPPFDMEKRTEQYVKLRDHINSIKEKHKAELAGPTELLDQLNNLLLAHLDQQKAENIGTKQGSVYKTAKNSASIADMTAFWTHIVTQGEWDLLDRRANVTAVKDYIEKNSAPVPGVNFTQRFVVGVRRK